MPYWSARSARNPIRPPPAIGAVAPGPASHRSKAGRYSRQISHRRRGFQTRDPTKTTSKPTRQRRTAAQIALPPGVARRVNRGFFRRESTTADKIGNGEWLLSYPPRKVHDKHREARNEWCSPHALAECRSSLLQPLNLPAAVVRLRQEVKAGVVTEPLSRTSA